MSCIKLLIYLLLLSLTNAVGCFAADEASIMEAKLAIFRYRLTQVSNIAEKTNYMFFIYGDFKTESILLSESNIKKLKPSKDFFLGEDGIWRLKSDETVVACSMGIANARMKDNIFTCDLIQNCGALSEIGFHVRLRLENGKWIIVSFELDESNVS